MISNKREIDNNYITSILPKLLDRLIVVTDQTTNWFTYLMTWGVGFRSDFTLEDI